MTTNNAVPVDRTDLVEQVVLQSHSIEPSAAEHLVSVLFDEVLPAALERGQPVAIEDFGRFDPPRRVADPPKWTPSEQLVRRIRGNAA